MKSGELFKFPLFFVAVATLEWVNMMEYGYLFVNDVPLLVRKRNLARQQQVEMWLDLTQLLKEIGLTVVTVIPEVKKETLAYIS